MSVSQFIQGERWRNRPIIFIVDLSMNWNKDLRRLERSKMSTAPELVNNSNT